MQYAGGCIPWAVLKLDDGTVKGFLTIAVHECAALKKPMFI